MFAFLPFLAESPKYLLSKGKGKEAARAMQFYRGQGREVSQDMEALKLEEQDEKATESISIKQLVSTVRTELYSTTTVLKHLARAGSPTNGSCFSQVDDKKSQLKKKKKKVGKQCLD